MHAIWWWWCNYGLSVTPSNVHVTVTKKKHTSVWEPHPVVSKKIRVEAGHDTEFDKCIDPMSDHYSS